MFVVVERFLYGITKNYGKHPVSTDGGTWYPPQACKFLKLKHHIHVSHEKSIIIERTIQYIKDRTECFDDYFPCRKKNCKLKHVKQWLNLFAYHHNNEIYSNFTEPYTHIQHFLNYKATIKVYEHYCTINTIKVLI